AAQATVKVTTTANSAQVIPSHQYVAFASMTGIFGLLTFSSRMKPSNRRKIRLSLGLLILLALAMAFPSCGGGTSQAGGGSNGCGTTGTPTGTTNLLITAYTVSGDTSTANVSLTVR